MINWLPQMDRRPLGDGIFAITNYRCTGCLTELCSNLREPIYSRPVLLWAVVAIQDRAEAELSAHRGRVDSDFFQRQWEQFIRWGVL